MIFLDTDILSYFLSGNKDIYLIAAVVIANKGILVTNNEKHYSRICDLRIENWLAG